MENDIVTGADRLRAGQRRAVCDQTQAWADWRLVSGLTATLGNQRTSMIRNAVSFDGPRRNGLTWFGLLLVATAAGCVGFALLFVPGQATVLRLTVGAIAVALLSLGLGLGWQASAALVLRQALLWASVGVAAVTGLSFRTEVAHVLSMIITTAPDALHRRGDRTPDRIDVAPGLVSLRAEGSGHFLAEALVNGTHVSFLVDTGATDVALTRIDAQRIGIDLEALDFRIPVKTANGLTRAAPVALEVVTIGTIELENVTAMVAEGELTQSLLGMSFLKRLSSFSFDSDRLVMRQ